MIPKRLIKMLKNNKIIIKTNNEKMKTNADLRSIFGEEDGRLVELAESVARVDVEGGVKGVQGPTRVLLRVLHLVWW